MITQSRKDVCRICDKCDGTPKREDKTPRQNCRGEVARGREGKRNGVVTSRICNILRCRAKISHEKLSESDIVTPDRATCNAEDR